MDYIERLQKDFPEHIFEVIPVENEERSWRLRMDGKDVKVKWSQETETDLETYHNLRVEDELYSLIHNEIRDHVL